MKALGLATLTVMLAAPALAASIVPYCPQPRSGLDFGLGFQFGEMSESERTAFYQQRLRGRGIDAEIVAMWNGCVKAYVRESGHLVMRFYDPRDLEEIPLER